MIVQFAGDFRETYLELQSGQAESYYAQAHSVLGVRDMTVGGRVVTICCVTDESYECELSEGLFAVGLKMLPGHLDEKRVWEAVKAWQPTHLVLRSPWHQLLKLALKHEVPTLLTIADSFNRKGLRSSFQRWRMVRTWNSAGVIGLANHGRTSSRQLLRLGADPRKVIAWDWPHNLRPDDHPAKQISADRETSWRLLYAGSISAAKGVGDLIEAARLLMCRGMKFQLEIAGGGDTAFFAQQCLDAGVDKHTLFLGRQPHAKIISLMRGADLVIVPSRHEYPEGFPMTLFESLAVRTPIVASDHPMFTPSLHHGVSAMIFKEKDSLALAKCVEELLSDPALYASISQQSMTTWNNLQVPIEWVQLLKSWFLGDPKDFEQLLSLGVKDLN